MPEDAAAVAGASGGPTGESLSCVTCRSRKLRCDKVKPVCTRCAKVNGSCVYPESRRKPTFKRRNVQELEERLAQVEGLLRQARDGRPFGDDGGGSGDTEDLTPEAVHIDAFETPITEDVLFEGINYDVPDIALDDSAFGLRPDNPAAFVGNHPVPPMGNFSGMSGELIDLGGVFEPLPPFEIMEDLNRLFFKHQQQFAPIVHSNRYLQAFYSPPHMKPPMCLQYAIWALASNNDPKYHAYHDEQIFLIHQNPVFYRRARQYADMDEMKGNGEHFLTVAHAQAWCVLAIDEAKSTMFTRAAMSCARAARLAAMMGLHHMDAPRDESSPTIAPPRDWAELEERRRTFWGTFCIDSHCSISTGWPHLIDLADVTTHLPATEAAFQNGIAMETCTIHDAFKGGHSYSSFAGSVIVCHLFNLILKHAHRPKENDNPDNYEYGEYWKRHRDLDNTLSNAFMFLPETLRLPENYREATAVNLNLNLHASIICLHHAALERIETHSLGDTAKRISRNRLSTAAQEIVNIIKLTSHLSAGPRTPLAALSLFCGASVYMHFCKEKPTPADVDNLDFMLSAMEAIGRTHSLTRSFLRQTLLDIDRNGVQDTIQLPRVARLNSLYLNNAISHYVPLLARTRLSRHSEAQPPLPGLQITRTVTDDMPLSSTSWTRAVQNPGPSSSINGRSSDRHTHKRQRTAVTADSANQSLCADAGVSNGPSLQFSYPHMISEHPTTPNRHDTGRRNSHQSDINSAQNRILPPGILEKSGPKPFTIAGTAGGDGGVVPGWDPQQGDGGDITAQYVYPPAAAATMMGIDWDVLDANLGVVVVPAAVSALDEEGNQGVVDRGGGDGGPDVG
ncbi:hypothetical protein F4777DRAFT_363724 [Nemania sp. FL0916]|nr:hypothetical protein F4777DRAFT_363724 [Nemania sp. FL0916]